MGVKLNNSDQYESIMITLDPEKYPIAYKNKLDELMEEGAFPTIEEAEKWIRKTPIEMELYYEKGCGLFLVEADAVESGTIYSPYSGELCDDYDPCV